MFELPIKISPKTSHLFYSLPLSVAFCNNTILNWFHSEFIQMFTFRDHNDCVRIKLYNYGNNDKYDSVESIGMYQKFNLHKDIIDALKIFIKNQYYIFLFCNVEKAKIIKDIGLRNIDCDWLIYGYSDENKTFKVFTYRDSNIIKFEISYDDFLFLYETEERDFHIRMLCKSKNIKYELDLVKIKWHFLDYLNGIDTLKRERPELYYYLDRFAWGIKCYDEIINMYKIFLDQNMHFGLGETYSIYEHKEDMIERIKYLNDNSDLKYTSEILDLFEQVKQEATLLMNSVVKADMTRKFGLIYRNTDNLTFHVNKLKDLEERALNKYYEYNKKQFDDI